MEPQIGILRHPCHCEEKAGLSSVIILEFHVRISVRTHHRLKVIIFPFVFFGFLNLAFLAKIVLLLNYFSQDFLCKILPFFLNLGARHEISRIKVATDFDA